MNIVLDKNIKKKIIIISITIIFPLILINCGPKGPRIGDHSKHMGHGKNYTLLTKNDIKVSGPHDINFNNSTKEQYQETANLSGNARTIQENTVGLWPRAAKGNKYEMDDNEVKITENDKFLIIETNNLPDHSLTTTNPNRANAKYYKFLVPKSPKMLSSPYQITEKLRKLV